MIVTVSGIDGSGKTTRSTELCEMLLKRGLPAAMSKPAYEANEQVKDFCEWEFGDRFSYFRKMDAEFYVSCLTADWLGYLVRILTRSNDRILVCDRYVYDVLAQAIHMKARATVLKQWLGRFPTPDVSFLLDVSPELAYERLKCRLSPKMHEAEGLAELHVLKRAYEVVETEFGWEHVVVTAEQETSFMADIVERVWKERDDDQ